MKFDKQAHFASFGTRLLFVSSNREDLALRSATSMPWPRRKCVIRRRKSSNSDADELGET